MCAVQSRFQAVEIIRVWLKSVGAISRRCPPGHKVLVDDFRLENNGVPIWSADGRDGILRERYVTSVRLNLHEATALFLASRLLSRYSDENHPHVVRAMEKLAAAMPRDMMQRHIQRTADLVRERRERPDFTRMLERLTEARRSPPGGRVAASSRRAASSASWLSASSSSRSR
jgi:hypothetical protein